MAELKLNLKDSTGLSEKRIDTETKHKKYILFIAKHILKKEDKEFIFSFLDQNHSAVIVTDEEKNSNIKYENCRVFVFDISVKSKLEKMISIIKPIKIIEEWKRN